MQGIQGSRLDCGMLSHIFGAPEAPLGESPALHVGSCIKLRSQPPLFFLPCSSFQLMKSPHNLSSYLSDGGDNPIYLEDIYKHKHCPETERHWLDFLLVHFVGICYLSAISPTEPGRVLRSEAKHNERAEVVLYIFTMRESPGRTHTKQ